MSFVFSCQTDKPVISRITIWIPSYSSCFFICLDWHSEVAVLRHWNCKVMSVCALHGVKLNWWAVNLVVEFLRKTGIENLWKVCELIDKLAGTLSGHCWTCNYHGQDRNGTLYFLLTCNYHGQDRNGTLYFLLTCNCHGHCQNSTQWVFYSFLLTRNCHGLCRNNTRCIFNEINYELS